MTIDEAIAHALEVAGEQQERADSAELIDILDGLDVESCKECAADHRQLAAWLRELKELRLTVGMIKVEDLKSALTLLREYKADNNEMRERIERLDSENFKLTEKLEEIGTAYNEQVSLVGWHEEQEKEYKRLLKAAIGTLNDGSCGKDCSKCKWNNGGCEMSCRFAWIHTDEALELIGETND